MKERTASEYVIFSLAALQDTAQSVDIDFQGSHFVEDHELINMIAYARKLGLKVILKPTVNCRNGTWRAHINFLIKIFRANQHGESGFQAIQSINYIMAK